MPIYAGSSPSSRLTVGKASRNNPRDLTIVQWIFLRTYWITSAAVGPFGSSA
jgi:hypothetical protein